MSASTTRTPPAVDIVPPRLRLILITCCLGQFLNVLDASVVNVALPVINDELHFGQNSLQWVNNAYTIAVCGFLLLGGRLADLYGQRRVFLAGVALFTLASAVGGFASGPVTLVLARGLQGLGAAVMAPATLTVLGSNFTEPFARARAFGMWSAVSGAAGAVGVIVGGVITEWFSWRWILLVNIPIGLVLFAAVCWVVPETLRDGERPRLDIVGALTVTLGLMATVYAISASHTYGWAEPRVVAALAAGVALLALFLLRQAKYAPQPLIPLGVFRNRVVSAANAVAFFGVAALFSTFYFLTLILQYVLGYTPLQAGLAYLPLSLGLALGGWGVSSLLPRTGPRPIMLCGLSLAAAGLLWLGRADETTTYAAGLLGPALLLGLGMGAVLNATTNAGTAGLPRHQAGLASGLLQTTRQLGSALGLVVLTTLAAARTGAVHAQGSPGATEPAQHALASGYGLALTGAACFAVAGLLAALAVPVRDRSREARAGAKSLASRG